MKICKCCGTEYHPKSNAQQFCSIECKNKFNEVEYCCEWCGKVFSTIFKKTRFCSSSCATSFQMSNDDMKAKIIKKRKENWKGWKHSEEWKKKQSDNMKGREITWGDKISLALKGKPHPAYRKNFHHSEETKQVLRQKAIEQMKNPEMRKLISIRTSEGQKGRKQSDETKQKIGVKNRINLLNRIKNTLSNGDQLSPNYNTKACEYFMEYDLQHHTNGQYATNGGEYYIEGLGYWVDYINHDLKVIIEWDERHHYDVYGNLREKDIVRQKQIQNKFPDYEFIRINEDKYNENNGN